MDAERFVERLASAQIGATFNFYREGAGAELRRTRLQTYLEQRAEAPLLLVGEAPGYRGARVSGLPFTSERQLTGEGPAEATATIVQRVLAELELDALCWNVVPTHPGTESSNRRPSGPEIQAARPFLDELKPAPAGARGRTARGQGHGGSIHSPSVPWRRGRISGRAATVLRRRAPVVPPFSMKTYNAKPGEIARHWYVVDADGQTLGRLATRIADTLRGKGKAEYTPHVDTGDFVIVVNAEKIHVTGNKLDQKRYYRHSGYPGGLRSRTLREQLDRRPEEVLRKAVKGMLPRNRLARQQINKLKIYAGPEHPHAPQAPQPLNWEES